MSLVRNIVSDVGSHKHPHFLTLGLVFTIWTVSSGFAAIIDGLDIVYRVRESRSVWKTRPIALGLTLLVGSLLLVAVGLMVEGTYFAIWFAGKFDLNPAILFAWRYLRWGIAIVFAVLAVEILYHFGPNAKQRFRDSLTGAIVAVMTAIGLSYLLGVTFDTSIILTGLMDSSEPPSAYTCGFTFRVLPSWSVEKSTFCLAN